MHPECGERWLQSSTPFTENFCLLGEQNRAVGVERAVPQSWHRRVELGRGFSSACPGSAASDGARLVNTLRVCPAALPWASLISCLAPFLIPQFTAVSSSFRRAFWSSKFSACLASWCPWSPGAVAFDPSAHHVLVEPASRQLLRC